MKDKLFTGVISFVHHQKHYATIDYTDGSKKKTINFQTDIKDTVKSGISVRDKKHHFRSGDTVNFQIKLTPRGDRMNACDVKFLYNNELDKLLQKAKLNNHFRGFLKVADESYFIKELHSYLFFPLVLSPWENKPAENSFNEAFDFRLINIDKQNISAELMLPEFINAYKTAMRLYKSKTPLDATVTKISPYGIYINILNESMQAKLSVNSEEVRGLQPGDKIKVVVTYLSSKKIAVEKVS